MKETKLPKGVVENSVDASDGSWSLPEKPSNQVDGQDKDALRKKFAINRGAFTGPSERDGEDERVLMREEEKAESGESDAGE